LRVIRRTDRQTDRQTDRTKNITSFFGGGNYMRSTSLVHIALYLLNSSCVIVACRITLQCFINVNSMATQLYTMQFKIVNF